MNKKTLFYIFGDQCNKQPTDPSLLAYRNSLIVCSNITTNFTHIQRQLNLYNQQARHIAYLIQCFNKGRLIHNSAVSQSSFHNKTDISEGIILQFIVCNIFLMLTTGLIRMNLRTYCSYKVDHDGLTIYQKKFFKVHSIQVNFLHRYFFHFFQYST